MTDGVRTWPSASKRLAQHVMRWERLGALLWPMGILLGVGAVLTLVSKASGIGHPAALAPLGVALVLGLIWARVRARRLEPIRDADAAWALDRISGAKERGLVAATVPGPVGAEAAWGPGRVDPPRARLLPPKGFALALGTGLLAVVAVLAPAAKPTAAAVAAPQVPARSEVGAGALDAEEGEAWAAQDEALKVEQIREALGLGPRAATDPHRIAKRLEDPEVLDAVKDAAKRSGDGELVRLATAGSESAEDLAKRLGQGMDAGKRAEEARRRLTALRAGGTRPPVPIARRTFLERYFEERGHGRRDTGAR